MRRRDGGKLWITAGDSALRTKPSLQPPTMKVTFGALVITAGVCGVLSFAFLATSLGTDYWYIIEMNTMNTTEFEDMSSHSGLWRINEGRLRL